MTTPDSFASAAGDRLATLVKSSARLCQQLGAWVGLGVGVIIGVGILLFAVVFVAPPLFLWTVIWEAGNG